MRPKPLDVVLIIVGLMLCAFIFWVMIHLPVM